MARGGRSRHRPPADGSRGRLGIHAENRTERSPIAQEWSQDQARQSSQGESMAALAEVNKIIAFLRMDNPLEDISVNPVVEHPHNTSRTIPERLPAATVKELSRLDPAKAI